ncbi:MAG: DUF4398 domain-containing protein [Gammaproteobacteria bacterium]
MHRSWPRWSSIGRARTALRNVQSTDAQELAPVELDRARSKFQRAEAAYAEEEYDDARRLAQESLADAELAAAKANAINAKRSAEELEKSIAVLRQEIERARSGM